MILQSQLQALQLTTHCSWLAVLTVSPKPMPVENTPLPPSSSSPPLLSSPRPAELRAAAAPPSPLSRMNASSCNSDGHFFISVRPPVRRGVQCTSYAVSLRFRRGGELVVAVVFLWCSPASRWLLKEAGRPWTQILPKYVERFLVKGGAERWCVGAITTSSKWMVTVADSDPRRRCRGIDADAFRPPASPTRGPPRPVGRGCHGWRLAAAVCGVRLCTDRACPAVKARRVLVSIGIRAHGAAATRSGIR